MGIRNPYPDNLHGPSLKGLSDDMQVYQVFIFRMNGKSSKPIKYLECINQLLININGKSQQKDDMWVRSLRSGLHFHYLWNYTISSKPPMPKRLKLQLIYMRSVNNYNNKVWTKVVQEEILVELHWMTEWLND